MKIMFHTLSLGRGGAERVISNLCASFPKNYDKSIVISQNSDIGYKFSKNISVINLNPNQKKNFILKNLTILKNLYVNIETFKPDVIVCFLNEASMRTLFLKKISLIGKKTKIIVSVRNDPKVIYKNRLKKALMKILFKKSDGFVFQTEEAMNYFDDSVKKKSTVIPNPINDIFLNEEKYKNKRRKEIVTVGRLTEQKNHELLIDAFAEVSDKYPEFKLKIYGDGPLREKLENFVKEKKLIDKVLFMGTSDHLEKDLVPSYMFVLPSFYEGMPNALMEALALGLPCISTDCPCGGPRFLIENGINGFLIENNNRSDLIRSIEYLIENPKIASKIGDCAKEKSKNLSSSKINSKWVKFIWSVIDNEH